MFLMLLVNTTSAKEIHKQNLGRKSKVSGIKLIFMGKKYFSHQKNNIYTNECKPIIMQ